MKPLHFSLAFLLQAAFLDLLRTTHKDDVLTPLRDGKIDENITAAIEQVAAEIKL